MKKNFIILILLLSLLAVPAVSAAETAFISDNAGLLTSDEWETLEYMGRNTAQALGSGVYVITVEDFSDYGSGDVYQVAYQLYHQLNLGEGPQRNGILLLLSMEFRDYALFVYGPDAEKAFSDYALRQLEEEFLDDLQFDDWYGGLYDYMSVCHSYLEQAAQGAPVEENMLKYVPVVIIIASAVALIVCLIFKAQMKSVFRKAEADAYTAGSGLDLTGSRDLYTHTTTSRTRINRNSGSGSRSGGGGHGRSGKF